MNVGRNLKPEKLVHRSSLFATAVALAYAAVSSAGAAEVARSAAGGDTGKRGIARQCLDDLQKFDEKLARVGFGVLPPGGFPSGSYGEIAPTGDAVWGVETPREKIRSLRGGAYIYALDGNEQSCQMVVTSMRKVYDEHQMAVGAQANDPTVWRRAHLARAEPVDEMNHPMRADSLIGAELRNLKDDRLGEIEDIVFNPEKRQILYVLVSHGGFLGFGEKLVAVRWSDLRATDDHELYVLDVPPKAFDAAPTVDRRSIASTADPNWQRSLDHYWDHVVK